MRNTTLDPLLTAPGNGLTSTLSTVSSGCVIRTGARPVLRTLPALATATLVAWSATAKAVKFTIRSTLPPGASGPTLVQVSRPAPVVEGVGAADT